MFALSCCVFIRHYKGTQHEKQRGEEGKGGTEKVSQNKYANMLLSILELAHRVGRVERRENEIRKIEKGGKGMKGGERSCQSEVIKGASRNSQTFVMHSQGVRVFLKRVTSLFDWLSERF